MKVILTTVAVGGALCCASTHAADQCCTPTSTTQAQHDNASLKGLSRDRVSIFQAPLQCPAAPQIGCGSHAKPILLELEQAPGVTGAWLNRAGTEIAVVWKPDADTKARSTATAKLQEHEATEMQGKARDEAVASFLSGGGWYHGAEVDRLSEEESGIIAARLVRRVQAKTFLAQEKVQGLQTAIADALRKRFTDNKAKQNQNALLKSKEGLQQAARPYLTKDQIPILKESIAMGLRPLPNEN